MTSLHFLWPYLRHEWRPLLLGSVVAALGAGVAALAPLVLRWAVDSLQAGAVDTGLLLQAALLLVLVGAVDGLFKYAQRMAFGVGSYNVEYALRADLFAQLLRLDQAFFGKNHTGDLMARATNDLSAVRMFLGPGLSSVVGALCTLAAAAVLMLQVNLTLAALVLLLLPTVSLLFTTLGWRMQRAYGQVQSQFGDLSTRAQENFSGIRTIKAYAQEQAEIEVFARANAEYRRLNLRYVLLSGVLWPAMTFALGLVGALLVLVGGRMVAAGTLSLGELVLFIAYLGLLAWPMMALGWTVTLYQQSAASILRIAEVLKRQPAITNLPLEAPGAVAPAVPPHTGKPGLLGELELRDVSVSLDDQSVLQNVSLRVPAGTSLAIVGATGAGKSVLVGLLGRVRDPDAGQILLDGTDLRAIPLATLRRAIGYVLQETFLFSVPLRENLLFGYHGEAGAAEQRIAEALEVSQLVNDLPQFPQGLDTLIGERGVTLSGGQKQRAALARALLHDPAVLVLDDALSSVDTYTAARILERLRAFMRGRTSILISQRIATGREADQIVVLDEGRVAERGTHAALLALDGRYAAMYRRELLRAELGEE
jgi:ATP-binding cassette subfamily B protein